MTLLYFPKMSLNTKKHLLEIANRLNSYGLTLNMNECVFGASQLNVLGYKLNASGITASDEKIAAVKNSPEPVTIKELRQFLGPVNYQRRFIENAAELLSPLQDYLKGKVKNETKISLNCIALQAFKKVKEIIANLAYLAHPKAYAKLQLKTDASATSLGNVLKQIYDDKIEVLGYYSKSLTDAQKHGSQSDAFSFPTDSSINIKSVPVPKTNFCILIDTSFLHQARQEGGPTGALHRGP